MTTLVQILQKPEQSRNPAVMPGILHLGCTGMRRHLGGDEQKLQPTNPDGMIYHLLRFADRLWRRFTVGSQIIFTQRGLIFSEWFERKGL